MSDLTGYCKHCDNEMETYNTFCCHSCKDDYHNGLRKIQRARKRYNSALGTLNKFISGNSARLHNHAIIALQEIETAQKNINIILEKEFIDE